MRPGRWHFAELIYDAGQVLALSLDGQLLGVRTTAGLPIRPVAGAGILAGYWPGGDDRYTFRGLLGPVWIDLLDEREPSAAGLNKLLCEGSDGTSRLEAADRVLSQELSPDEKMAVSGFGKAVVESGKRMAAVVIGQAGAPAAKLGELIRLSNELGRLTAAHEAASTEALRNPALRGLLGRIYAAACQGNPAAASLFTVEALKILAALPLSPSRWEEIRKRHPELCLAGFEPLDLSAGGPAAGSEWVDALLDRLCAARSGGGRPSEPPPCREGEGSQGVPGGNIHIHVHCSEHKERE